MVAIIHAGMAIAERRLLDSMQQAPPRDSGGKHRALQLALGKLAEGVGRQRPREVVTLNFVHQQPQPLAELQLGLDPLGDDSDVETVAQLGDGLHKQRLAGIAVHLLDE